MFLDRVCDGRRGDSKPLVYLAQPTLPKEPSQVLIEKREALLKKFPEIIFKDEKSATITFLVRCKLYPKHNRLIREEIRNLGFHKRRWLTKEIDELLAAGIIKLSKSLHIAASIIVNKKDGT